MRCLVASVNKGFSLASVGKEGAPIPNSITPGCVSLKSSNPKRPFTAVLGLGFVFKSEFPSLLVVAILFGSIKK